jgi:excisionase family DNA binding protein
MTTATDTPRLLTVKEAARSLGISREAAYRLVRSGILPAYRVGPHGGTGPLRVDANELDEWLSSRRTTKADA